MRALRADQAQSPRVTPFSGRSAAGSPNTSGRQQRQAEQSGPEGRSWRGAAAAARAT